MPGPEGSVTGAGTFSHGTLTAISANPDTGYSFSGWTGEGVSDPNSPSTTALMDQNRSMTATFSLNSYELNLHAGSGGSVTGAGNFSHGTLTAISANSDTGYSFSGWTGEESPIELSIHHRSDGSKPIHNRNLLPQLLRTEPTCRVRRFGHRGKLTSLTVLQHPSMPLQTRATSSYAGKEKTFPPQTNHPVP